MYCVPAKDQIERNRIMSSCDGNQVMSLRLLLHQTLFHHQALPVKLFYLLHIMKTEVTLGLVFNGPTIGLDWIYPFGLQKRLQIWYFSMYWTHILTRSLGRLSSPLSDLEWLFLTLLNADGFLNAFLLACLGVSFAARPKSNDISLQSTFPVDHWSFSSLFFFSISIYICSGAVHPGRASPCQAMMDINGYASMNEKRLL